MRTKPASNANLIRSKMRTFDWLSADMKEQRQTWGVYLCDDLDFGMVYVETDGEVDDFGISNRIAVSPSLWVMLSYHAPAVTKLFMDMRQGGTGMRFIVGDAGPYGEAARRQDQARTGGRILGKDPLVTLLEDVKSLGLQAASLNQSPTELQTMTFGKRYTDARQRLADLQAQLKHAEAALDLAGSALWTKDA